MYIPTGFEEVPERRERDLSDHNQAVTVGMLGRWTVEKRHDRLIQAVASQVKLGHKVKLLLAGGRGIDTRNSKLLECLRDSDLIEHTELFGAVQDVEEFWNQIDIFCLFSDSEGLPTVIGEAMAHALPCLVCDVGDSRVLLADPEQICDLNDIEEIRQKLSRMVAMTPSERKSIGQRNLRRIRSQFSMRKMFERYESVYESIVSCQ